MTNKSLKDKVKYVLTKYAKSRDCDDFLFEGVLSIFHKSLLSKDTSGNKTLSFRNRKIAPSSSVIERWRRKLQSEYKSLQPTDPIVLVKRGLRTKQWLEELGYTV